MRCEVRGDVIDFPYKPPNITKPQMYSTSIYLDTVRTIQRFKPLRIKLTTHNDDGSNLLGHDTAPIRLSQSKKTAYKREMTGVPCCEV